MPAAAMTWQEVFALVPAVFKNAGVSGLAQQDRGTTGTPPLATYEVHVQGNRIVDATGDRYIAGLFFISQQSLNVGQGYINYIDLPAPFEIGDYVSYSGMLVYDGAASGTPVTPTTARPVSGSLKAGDTYISAHSIIASLGSVAEAAAGGGGTLFSTGTGINIAAMDVACDGTITDRLWAYSVASDPGTVFGGAVAGRWRFRPTGGIFLPPSRNLRASMSDTRGMQGFRLITNNLPPKPGDTTGTPQGLETGQYNAPIFTFIFPENLVIGGPTIGNNFGDFPFLANGSGPYSGPSGVSGSIVGQLSPWPGLPAPSSSCGASAGGGTATLLNAPEIVATASTGQANSGNVVTLTAVATDLNLPPQAITSIRCGGKVGKLQVTAASNVPTSYDPNTLEVLNPRFTLTFVVSDFSDPRYGQVVTWSSWAMILGLPTATVLGFPMPDSVTVTSSAGGSITVFSSNFIVR